MKKLTVLFLVILCCGCGGGNYIRSDVFLDTGAIKSVCVMPIAPEITVGPGMKTSREELRAGLESSLAAAIDTVKAELNRRGYQVESYPKPFAKLDINDPRDKLVREAVLLYFKPQETTPFLKVQTKPAGDGKDYNVGVQNFSSESYDPLVERSLDALGALPAGTDAVVYLGLKSQIARRGMFNSLTDESTLWLDMKILSLAQKTVIYSAGQSYAATDALSRKKLIASFEDFVKYIPVKLN